MTEPAPTGFLRNTGVLVGSRLVVAALGWLGTVLIVRTLGPTDFGRFAFVFSLLATLSIVTSMGVSRVALAAILAAGDRRGRVAGSYVVLRSILGLVGYCGAIGFVVIGGYDDDVVHAVAVAGVVVLLATPSSALNVVFQATGRMGAIAIAGVLGQWAQLALTVALVLGPATLVWLTVPAVLNEVVALATKARAAHRAMPLRLRVDLGLWGRMLREAVPLTVGRALESLYYRVDVIMLSRMAPFGSVGSYGVALKFSDLIYIIPTAMSAAILPVLVASSSGAMDQFRSTLRQAAGVLAFCAGLAVGGFAVFAQPALELLFGDEFAGAATSTRLLVGSQSLGFASALAFTCLVATGRHRVYPFISLAGLVVNVVLNLVLIPRYSISGAAIASLATLALVSTLMVWMASRIPGIRGSVPVRALGVLPALAALVGVGVALQLIAPWPLAAAVAAATYVAVAMGLGVVGLDDLKGLAGRQRMATDS